MKFAVSIIAALLVATASAQQSGLVSGNFLDELSISSFCDVLPSQYITDCECLILMTNERASGQLNTPEFCSVPECLTQYQNFQAAIGASSNSNCSILSFTFSIGGSSTSDCSRCDLMTISGEMEALSQALGVYLATPEDDRDCSPLSGYTCCHALAFAAFSSGGPAGEAFVQQALAALETCGVDVGSCDLCPAHAAGSGETCDNLLASAIGEPTAPAEAGACLGYEEYSVDLLFNQAGCSVDPREYLVTPSCLELVNEALLSPQDTPSICSNSTCAGEVRSLNEALIAEIDAVPEEQKFFCGSALNVMSGLVTFTPSSTTNCSSNCANAFLELETIFPDGPPTEITPEQCSQLSCCHTAALKVPSGWSVFLGEGASESIIAVVEATCNIPADCPYFRCDGSEENVCPLIVATTAAPAASTTTSTAAPTTTPAPTSGAFSASLSVVFVGLTLLLASMMA